MFDQEVSSEIRAGKALTAAVDELVDLAVGDVAEDTVSGGDLDRLFDDQLATLLVQVHTERERLAAVELAATAEFADRDGAANEGFPSVSSWLAAKCRMAWGAARRQLGLAQSLTRMRATLVALASGRLDLGRVRRLAAAEADHSEVFGRDEHVLVDAAATLTPRDTARAIDYWRQGADAEQFADDDQAQFDRRRLHLSPTGFGMGRLDADLDAESLHVISTAIDAHAEPAGRDGDDRTPAQRRCDALVDICRHALDHADLPIHGGRRPHVTAIVDVAVLTDGASGTSEFGDGQVITADTARRLACDAAISRVITDGPSQILDVGRTTRTVPAAIRTALNLRDRGCVWEGCDRPWRLCDAHHIVHWADGGPTSLDNLHLLCRYHHRRSHEAEP